jgi:DNA-binding winged helix-turn-helix (wHTH) protein
MQALSHRIYRFDDFELDAHRRQLLCGGRPVTLQPKAVELLVALVEHGGQLLTKDDLLEQVWPGQIVEESNLTVHMSALRKALGQRKGEHRFVVTVPGQGYRFVADVVGSGAASDGEYSIESHEVSRIIVDQEAAGADEYGRAGPVVLFGATGNRRLLALILGGVLLLATGVLVYKLAWTRGGQERAALPPVAPPRLQLTRLTTVGGVLSTAVSPDGNYFVYAISEGDGQSLWVRQVSGARSIQIVPPEAVEYWGLTFSPDGTQVYASVFLPNETDTQFRRVPALGGVVERLPDLSPLSSIAFSPDGRRFAYVHTHAAAGQSQIEVADADGTNARKLAVRKQPAGFEFPGSVVSWSPTT